MTPIMRATINAMLDQAAARELRAPTLANLAARLGLRSAGYAHDIVKRLENRGLIDRTGPRIAFHWRCFKVFRVIDAKGNAALERWG